ncbi:MAG: HAMP domain-containing sensor histidine kinase [Pseudonocardia sp.]
MRRQLVITVVATSALILIALLLPMAALVQRFAVEDALAAAGLEVQATESVVAFRDRADLVSFIADINSGNPVGRTTVMFADGDAIGPDPEVTEDVLRARQTGRALSNDTAEGAEILVPVSVRGQPGDQEDAAPLPPATVIRVVIPGNQVNREVLLSWGVLAILGLGLLGLAVLVADRLGRTLVRPVTELARTAERLGRGDLRARAEPAGPPEVREVGQALNRLAARIDELLTAERESAADASHRLRTPITVLRLEAGELGEPAERSRMTAGGDALARAVDVLITEARRPVREGLGAASDAVATVAERAGFWRVLAEDQERRMRVVLPSSPLPVKAAADDVAVAVDVLLENLFSHTDEKVPFEVVVQPRTDGGARIVVSDQGAGFPDLDVVRRGRSNGGSTGLGLDIVRRTAEASGGHLRLENPPAGGARVTVDLGPPAVAAVADS